MVIDSFQPFRGENCEIATLGNLIKFNGMELSEPMLFGLGEALGFLFWDSKQLGYPIFLGRCKQDLLTENIVHRLGINLEIRETTSQARAWEYVKTRLDGGQPVGLKLDCYYLEYFHEKLHFAAHYVTMVGYDETDGYLIDTVHQNLRQKSSLDSIAQARNARGPMSSRNRAYTLTARPETPDLRKLIPLAIQNNARAYLNPPIRNANAPGIRKTAAEITHWLDKPEMTPELMIQVGVLMDKAGTGGGLFRNMYRDFLKECCEQYPELNLGSAYEQFREIAPMWSQVSELICAAGNTQTREPLLAAATLLMEVANREEEAMRTLSQLATSI